MAQLRDQVNRETLQNQKLTSDIANVRKQLANVEQRLSSSDKANRTLQQNTQQMQVQT